MPYRLVAAEEHAGVGLLEREQPRMGITCLPSDFAWVSSAKHHGEGIEGSPQSAMTARQVRSW